MQVGTEKVTVIENDIKRLEFNHSQEWGDLIYLHGQV